MQLTYWYYAVMRDNKLFRNPVSDASNVRVASLHLFWEDVLSINRYRASKLATLSFPAYYATL